MRYGLPLCSCAVGALDKPAWSASVDRRHTHYLSRTPVERENGSSSLNDHGKACCDIQRPRQFVTATVDGERIRTRENGKKVLTFGTSASDDMTQSRNLR
jgi:hypothetical protein